MRVKESLRIRETPRRICKDRSRDWWWTGRLRKGRGRRGMRERRRVLSDWFFFVCLFVCFFLVFVFFGIYLSWKPFEISSENTLRRQKRRRKRTGRRWERRAGRRRRRLLGDAALVASTVGGVVGSGLVGLHVGTSTLHFVKHSENFQQMALVNHKSSISNQWPRSWRRWRNFNCISPVIIWLEIVH